MRERERERERVHVGHQPLNLKRENGLQCSDVLIPIFHCAHLQSQITHPSSLALAQSSDSVRFDGRSSEIEKARPTAVLSGATGNDSNTKRSTASASRRSLYSLCNLHPLYCRYVSLCGGEQATLCNSGATRRIGGRGIELSAP